jgi:hypothetical protein
MSRWMRVTIMAAAVAVINLFCSQQPSGAVAVMEDKTYTVTPASVTVKAGIITGEVIALKVTERVEKGSDRVVSPAKLTGTLRLKHTSANQTVRLVNGKILYIDNGGQPIKLEADLLPLLCLQGFGRDVPIPGLGRILPRGEPLAAVRDELDGWLDPCRLEPAYIPSPFREETVNFIVSVGEGE